ncbi:hypothetical protein [Sinorhizobium meliloti]|uniref:hypothetical protein n=1 Tax=Rhizobium meliloti TaxID=382 RepID=UPI00299E56FA|nr:hypothetical protein [Sinorhizobium meliloti]MDW9690559.1 hypothetical protein [Sinorhizobium meliloti]MDW9715404.1 hypothetical protein [Sinorhizobium meliloti]MDW9756648.1 hypothetical protein [Sinorhizobium meliloti]
MKLLQDLKVQISLSIPPDHLKLGIPPRELDRAMLSTCMAVVRAGAIVVYGGDLRPDGFTFKIFRHLARAYANTGSVPFVHAINHVSLSNMGFDVLSSALKERRGTCQTFLCVEGNMRAVSLNDDYIVVSDTEANIELDAASFPDWVAGLEHLEPSQKEITRARTTIAGYVDATIAIGGKMGLLANQEDGYSGNMPGILEESFLTLEIGKPFIPLAAYGGATRDLAIKLELLETESWIPRGAQAENYNAALETALSYRDRIPTDIAPKLATLANDDRTEIVARETVKIIRAWLDGKQLRLED